MTYNAYGEQMEDGVSIDWSKPIEAVHEDGRVVAVTFVDRGGSGTFNVSPSLDGYIYSFCRDGSHISASTGWRIRNVAQPSDDYTRGRTDGIRDALAALPASYAMETNSSLTGYNNALSDTRTAITALLPRDEAAELVKAFENDPSYAQDFHASLPDFARWLIDTGKIKGV